jgi:hypothetical protein
MKAKVSFFSNEAFTVRPRLISLQEDVAWAPIMQHAAKLLQAAECMLQELQPDSGNLCQLLDAKSPAQGRSSQGSNADQQL